LTDDVFEEAVGFQEVVGDGVGSYREDFGAEFEPEGGCGGIGGRRGWIGLLRRRRVQG